MRIRIEKALILETLRDEPPARLRPNIWIEISPSGLLPAMSGLLPDDPDCDRCAIGCLIVKLIDIKGMPVSRFNEVAATSTSRLGVPFLDEEDLPTRLGEEIQEALESERYFGALSLFFEGRAREMADDQSRYEMELSDDVKVRLHSEIIKFAEDNFPEQVIVDINGGKPRAGLAGITIIEE